MVVVSPKSLQFQTGQKPARSHRRPQPGKVPHRPTETLMRVERNLSVGQIRNIALDALARRQLDAPRLLQPQPQVARLARLLFGFGG